MSGAGTLKKRFGFIKRKDKDSKFPSETSLPPSEGIIGSFGPSVPLPPPLTVVPCPDIHGIPIPPISKTKILPKSFETPHIKPVSQTDFDRLGYTTPPDSPTSSGTDLCFLGIFCLTIPTLLICPLDTEAISSSIQQPSSGQQAPPLGWAHKRVSLPPPLNLPPSEAFLPSPLSPGK